MQPFPAFLPCPGIIVLVGIKWQGHNFGYFAIISRGKNGQLLRLAVFEAEGSAAAHFFALGARKTFDQATQIRFDFLPNSSRLAALAPAKTPDMT